MSFGFPSKALRLDRRGLGDFITQRRLPSVGRGAGCPDDADQCRIDVRRSPYPPSRRRPTYLPRDPQDKERPMRRLLLGAGVLTLLIAGCTAAAHLKVLEPPAAPLSPPITVPAAAVVPRPGRGTTRSWVSISICTPIRARTSPRPRRQMSPTSPACTPMRCRSRSPSSWTAPMRQVCMPPALLLHLASLRSGA